MNQNTDRNENIIKFREWIKDIRFAMLTMVEDDGTLRSVQEQLNILSLIVTFGSLPKLKRPRLMKYSTINMSTSATPRQMIKSTFRYQVPRNLQAIAKK
jgi:hypothetical protein